LLCATFFSSFPFFIDLNWQISDNTQDTRSNHPIIVHFIWRDRSNIFKKKKQKRKILQAIRTKDFFVSIFTWKEITIQVMSVCKYKKLPAFIFIFMWFQLVVLTHLRRKARVIIIRKEHKRLLFQFTKNYVPNFFLELWIKVFTVPVWTSPFFVFNFFSTSRFD